MKLNFAELATRRQALLGVLLATAPSHLQFASPALAADPAPVQALLDLIPAMPYGAPATNATVSRDLAARIDVAAAALEAKTAAKDLARDARLGGSWKLVYSDGREITSLAAGFPGGFELGPTYQVVDTKTGFFENQGSVVNRYGAARLSTGVVGDVRPSKPGTLNAVGVVNDRGNRIDVDFKRITFAFDELLGKPVDGPRKVLSPTPKPDAAQPANDITYLDATARVVRGGDGALFVFRRDVDNGARPLLTAAQRAELFGDASSIGVTTAGTAGALEADAPAELRRLLREPAAAPYNLGKQTR